MFCGKWNLLHWPALVLFMCILVAVGCFLAEDDDVKEQENNSKQKVKKNKKEKPMFLKDYERKIITEREGLLIAYC